MVSNTADFLHVGKNVILVAGNLTDHDVQTHISIVFRCRQLELIILPARSDQAHGLVPLFLDLVQLFDLCLNVLVVSILTLNEDDYICNPAKTDESILISSFGCSPETAAFDFKFALSKTNQADPNKAFHLIQAFMPGEVSYKEAHQIGIELADKLLEGKYSYIVATHIDKGHVHNHIIFCAADNINHEKYHDCKKTYYHIRHMNDELCSEHQLSVLPPTDQRGKTYKEWLSNKSNPSWKTRLKNDIDEAIQSVDTYEDLLDLIRA